MRSFPRFGFAFAALLFFTFSLAAADANRGRMVMEDQGCLACHTVRGQGIGHEALRPAKDLSGRLSATYSVAALASVLWNHEPGMFASLAASRTQLPPATESDWRDMFTYLYSLQFQDQPGDASKGAAAFASKGCANCHGAQAAAATKATPVQKWASVNDPVELLYQMWTHAATMYIKQTPGGQPWQQLAAADLMDLTAYAQSVQKLSPNSNFTLPAAAEGRVPYEIHCTTCHVGAMSLDKRLSNATWMEIGAKLWNHAPQMPSGSATTKEEMSKIVAYVWELQYAGAPGNGNSVAGGNLFRTLRCITCHKDASGAPRSPRPGPVSPFAMVSMSWSRGRQMHAQMVTAGEKWPQLSTENMADLAEYLNTVRY